MKPEEWNQIEELLQRTLNEPPGNRSAFLDRVCEGKENLRREVESLLAHHDQTQSFLEQPPGEIAAELLTSGKLRLLKGQFINHYTVIDFLGAGAMGEVYLARDARLQRNVAIKVLAGPYTSDSDKVRRFEQEARAASVLNHPNIVTIHEVGQADGVHFIVAECIEGQTLRQRLKQSGPMNVAEALDIAVQVGNALDAAHAAGIVHRDIKPENIMVRPDGLLKVLDFGLAKLSEPTTLASNQQEFDPNLKTHPGMVMGTARYMSPEQAAGQIVDARTDIWSLGVVLFEMLAGKPPFDGETPNHTIVRILDEPAPTLSAHSKGVSRELECAVNKTLCKNADERYATVKEFVEDLKKLRRQPADEGKLNPRPERRDWWKRGAVAAVATLVLAAGVLPFLAKPNRPIDSLAIVPFVNAGDASTDYLSDGLYESLVNTLSQIHQLKVAPRSMTDQYRAADLDPATIRRELGVRAILTGKVTARSDDADIQVSLVDAENMSELWKKTYSPRLNNMLDAEKEIAATVASKLGLQSGAKSDTNSNEAYRLYLQGRYYWQKANPEGAEKMREYLQKAIAVDPHYALAYAGLADYYASKAELDGADAWRKSEQAATRALALDESTAEAHMSLAAVRMWYDRKWKVAESELKRAIELNPDVGYGLYIKLLVATGRFEEAIAAWNRAHEVERHSPHRPRAFTPAVIYFHWRQYELAIEEYRKAIADDPADPFLHLGLGWLYAREKKLPEALAEARKAQTVARVNGKILGFVGQLFAVAGDVQEAKKILAQIEPRASKNSNVAHAVAALYAGLGKNDEAIAWLTRAVNEFAIRVVDVNVDPRFDSLRGDPRFKALMGQMNFVP